MSTETTNYKMIKPSLDEFYDIEVQNNNADIIDAQMKENADAAKKANANLSTHIADKKTHVTAEEREKWDDAYSKKHGHDNKGILDAVSASYTIEDKAKLDGIASGANAYALPAASASVRGGVKTGYTANGRNYPVQLSNEQMYVNVPWTDNNTTYNTATQSANGLMSAEDKKKLDGVASGANAYTHPNSGVAAGTYRSVVVNAQGHVTGGSNPVLTVAQGGTGATTAAQALANIGAAAVSHTHSYAGSTSAGGTATRALGDSDGAQINATYRKKAEGSVVRIQASAPADTTALWVS